MSSAERCRVVLPSRISRIFNRGSVTFKPALRRSLPSTWASGGARALESLGSSAIRYDAAPDYRPTDPDAPPHSLARHLGSRRGAWRLRLSHGRSAGQLPGRQERRSAPGRHDAHAGAVPARHAARAGLLRQGPLGLRLLLPARAPPPPAGAAPRRVLQGRQGDTLRAPQRARERADGARRGRADLEIPEDLAGVPRKITRLVEQRRCSSAPALAPLAFTLHALAAALAWIALERAVELDAVAVRERVAARAQLAEDTDARGVPGNLCGGLCGCRERPGRRERLRDTRVRRQLDAEEKLPFAGGKGDGAALAALAPTRRCAHGSERARATNASTSEPMVAANFGSNSSPVRRWAKAKRMVSSTRQPSGSIGVSCHSPSSMLNGPLTSCRWMLRSVTSVLRVVNSPCNGPCLTPMVATISVGVRDSTRAWVHQGRNCG